MVKCFDVIVVGAGPAGSAAAKVIAEGGAKVALLERGLFPGAKNVSGAGLYDTALLEKLYPNFHKEAPVERYITRKNLGFIADHEMMTISYQDNHKAEAPYSGYSVMRGKLDKWLAEQAVKAGAKLFNETTVTDVIKKGRKVCGVVVNNEERFLAPIVIAADGFNSFVAKAAGLKKEPEAHATSIGVKEIISLPREVIEERFQLKGDEGMAFELVGTVSGLANGGGFMYTNKDSVSIGIVAQLSTLKEKGHRPYELLEEFKAHPMIAPMIKDGQAREYGAHLIPEGGYNCFPKLSAPGIMVTGDAAGFVLVVGYLLLGINYAIESGAIAGQAALEAIEAQDYSARAMARYEKGLKEAGLIKTFKGFRGAPVKMVNNVNLQNSYPQLVCDIMHSLYDVGQKPLPKLVPMLLKVVKNSDVGLGAIIKDVIKIGGTLGW